MQSKITPLQQLDDKESMEKLEMALARSLYLMSRIATVGACTGRMKNLLGQLQQVMEHPATPSSLLESCGALHEQWQQLYQQRLDEVTTQCSCDKTRQVH